MEKTFNEGTIQTIGRGEKNLKELKVNNGNILLEIWDTAGQERYRALTKVFYKNAAVCILVYDITKKKTFEELKNYWVKEIKENSLPDLSKK